MIYFMRANNDGPVKIGWSHNLALRMKQVKSNSDTILTVIRLVEGDKWVERWFHKEFKLLRISGEWFRFDPSMMELSPPIDRPEDISAMPSDAKHATRTVPLHVRLSPEAADILRARAEDQRRPFAALLAIILEDAASRAPAPPNTHASTTEPKS